jgi:hypothetical protein
MPKKTYFRGTLTLVIDDSNSDTPAMVYARREKFASTYDCATSEGMVDDEHQLSEADLEWLESHRDKVERAFEIARKDHPEYS